MKTNHIEIELLEYLNNGNKAVRQRDIAQILGLSLGMTNDIIKRLVSKGLLKLQRVNSRNIQYIISPKGLEVISRKSYRYFKKTIKNVVIYREAIERLIQRLLNEGYTTIKVIGISDIDFIIEWACGVYGIHYLKEDKDKPNTFYIYSESYIQGDGDYSSNQIFLGTLFQALFDDERTRTVN
jgi:DNA-binding MarR family transcriptional regulator